MVSAEITIRFEIDSATLAASMAEYMRDGIKTGMLQINLPSSFKLKNVGVVLDDIVL